MVKNRSSETPINVVFRVVDIKKRLFYRGFVVVKTLKFRRPGRPLSVNLGGAISPPKFRGYGLTGLGITMTPAQMCSTNALQTLAFRVAILTLSTAHIHSSDDLSSISNVVSGFWTGPSASGITILTRGRKKHINIWHINNFSVTPVTDPPGREPDSSRPGTRTKTFMFLGLRTQHLNF